MRDLLAIRNIRFTPAPAGLVSTGLLGWVSLHYGGIELTDISVRETLERRHYLSFPETRRRTGRVQPPVRPASQDVRAEIEAWVFAELRRSGTIP